MSYYMRLILCIILLAMLILTFGVGVRWFVEYILSDFWDIILIVLFAISTCVVAALITGFLFNGVGIHG